MMKRTQNLRQDLRVGLGQSTKPLAEVISRLPVLTIVHFLLSLFTLGDS